MTHWSYDKDRHPHRRAEDKDKDKSKDKRSERERERERMVQFACDNTIDYVNAARKGKLKRVHRFLEGGVNVNAVDKYGCTALFWAACQGHTSVVALLLAQDRIDVNKKSGKLQWTALIVASVYGEREIVQRLLEHPDINVNSTDRFNNSALVLACEENNKSVMSSLLREKNIDMYIRSKTFRNKNAYELAQEKTSVVRRLFDLAESRRRAEREVLDYSSSDDDLYD